MFKCRTIRMANYLMSKGCKMIKIIPCNDNNGFLKFGFERNENLQKYIDAWNNGDKEKYSIYTEG